MQQQNTTFGTYNALLSLVLVLGLEGQVLVNNTAFGTAKRKQGGKARLSAPGLPVPINRPNIPTLYYLLFCTNKYVWQLNGASTSISMEVIHSGRLLLFLVIEKNSTKESGKIFLLLIKG